MYEKPRRIRGIKAVQADMGHTASLPQKEDGDEGKIKGDS